MTATSDGSPITDLAELFRFSKKHSHPFFKSERSEFHDVTVMIRLDWLHNYIESMKDA